VLEQIERRKLFDAANDGLGHITGVEQQLVAQDQRQGFHVFAQPGEEGQTTLVRRER
jgi:hypothetical protein